MNREPLLASREVSGDDYGRKVRGFLRVEGGLHMIKGNHAPYFGITCTVHQKGYPDRFWSGGADHETILRYWPKFADLVALHLSDIDGVPMHAAADGLCYLAGAVPGNFGEKYHAGNAKTYGRSDNSSEGCLKTFADYLRIPFAKAQAIAVEVEGMDRDAVREYLAGLVTGLRPQWKAEAEACIAAHNLKVFGDPWPAIEATA